MLSSVTIDGMGHDLPRALWAQITPGASSSSFERARRRPAQRHTAVTRPPFGLTVAPTKKLRIVGGQERDRGRDLLRRAEAARRRAGDIDLPRHADLLTSCRVVSMNPGAIGVDPDALDHYLLVGGPREAEDAGLGGGVMRVPRAALDPADRRHVDDRAVAARSHPLHGRTGAVEGSVEVH